MRHASSTIHRESINIAHTCSTAALTYSSLDGPVIKIQLTKPCCIRVIQEDLPRYYVHPSSKLRHTSFVLARLDKTQGPHAPPHSGTVPRASKHTRGRLTRVSDWLPTQPIFVTRRYASNTALRDHPQRDAQSCAMSGCGL